MRMRSFKIAYMMALALTLEGGCGSVSSPAGGTGTGGGTAGIGGRTGGAGQTGAGGAGGAMSCAQGCRNGRICNTATATCVDCLTSADCAGQVCDPASHTCVECLTNADCPTAMPACSSGHTCGGMCTTNASCTQGLPVCETATHACVECLTNADCGANGVCQADLTCG